jgi:hypothetical protein
MGQRLLTIHVDLLVELLKGYAATEDKPRYFRVTKDPLPLDVHILSVRQSQYRENTIELDLWSDSWSKEGPRTKIEPLVETITDETPVAGVTMAQAMSYIASAYPGSPPMSGYISGGAVTWAGAYTP